MKDLYVMTADSDAEALLRALLARPAELDIAPIECKVERFIGRDSGMVQQGPEILRTKNLKGEFRRAVLIWDRDGSGWEQLDSEMAAARIQGRLDGVTWADRSAAVVLVPELEEWLWRCPEALRRIVGLDDERMAGAVRAAAKGLGLPAKGGEFVKPKELFQEVYYAKQRKRPLPEEFATFGRRARVAELMASDSFRRFVEILRGWFRPDSGGA
jgi:hypothetical protein